MQQYPQALTIAGIDSDGGGGMPIDIKTMSEFRVYGLSVITEVVAANSTGILGSQMMTLDLVSSQFQALADDYQIRATKTGLLATTELIETVANNLRRHGCGALVVDPVILAKTGETLLSDAAIVTLKRVLMPMATVVTPNYYEAMRLTGIKVNDEDTMLQAARAIQAIGCQNVLIKGRHDQNGPQSVVNDIVLLDDGNHFWLPGPYYSTKRKNGTGDALSAAITAELANGETVETAIRTAKHYVDQTIENPIEVGHQFGPINHWAGRKRD